MCLDDGEGDGVDDVLDGGASAEVVDGAVKSLEHGADGIDAGGALDGFVGGVAGIEVREDEDIGAACDGAVGGFVSGDFGVGGGIVLEGAVDDKVRGAMFNQLSGLPDFIDLLAAS